MVEGSCRFTSAMDRAVSFTRIPQIALGHVFGNVLLSIADGLVWFVLAAGTFGQHDDKKRQAVTIRAVVDVGSHRVLRPGIIYPDVALSFLVKFFFMKLARSDVPNVIFIFFLYILRSLYKDAAV